MKVPISEIGKYQEKDILNSSGVALSNGVGRICTVVKPEMAFDDRRDTSPDRIAELFGGKWEDFNQHYIIQVSGCPLKCWYCYVDNLRPDREMNAKEVVDDFYSHWRQAQRCCIDGEINVLHFMGGAPGKYPSFWEELREEMDDRGFEDTVLFSDVVLVENHFYEVEPWKYLDIPNFILTGCLKGTNKKNFLDNTGLDLFEQSLIELENYLPHENFYLSLIRFDENDLEEIYKIISREKVDLLKIIDYEVTKMRAAGIV